MIKKQITRKKVPKKKGSVFVGLVRLCSLLLLLIILVFSVCSVGYVIFFRTVFAQQILPKIKNAIVFEEPNPPVDVELEQVEEKGIILKPVLPKVAIIIDDMGYHESTGRELLSIPFELTYSFLPFAPHTSKLEWLAYRTGKTIYLHLPLEPKGKQWNPGPGALSLADSPEVQKAKFGKCLDEVPHAVGLNNHMGSLYMEDKIAMTRLMQEIRSRRLSFIDSYTSSGSVGLSIAQGLKVKSARRNVFLDNILDQREICEQLEKLIKIAETRGVGIGIAHPHQETVKAISSCGELYRKRVQYVSIKDVI